MANKMIPEEELHDDFLRRLFQSEEPLKIPDGFREDVMDRIRNLQSIKAIKPYSPPFCLKWGVPGFIVSCLAVLLLWGPAEPAKQNPGFSLITNVFKEIATWFTGSSIDIHFPVLKISETVIWVLVGGIVLTWSFWLLSRLLEKKVKQ